LAVTSVLFVFILLREQSAPASVIFKDVTKEMAISFTHLSAPEKKYLIESMSGGVGLFDYNNDGCLDIYFTNALTVETARDPTRGKSALYRGNCTGFTDITEGSGVAFPGWAFGVVAADYDSDGYQDLYVTCFDSDRLYRNNRGNGTFSDVTKTAGVSDNRWSTGAAFGDYDRDGRLDLFVANYVDFKMDDLPEFGKGRFCKYLGILVQCGPRGLPGAGDSLFHNEGNGIFSDVSTKAGLTDANGLFGMGAVWTDADNDAWPDLFVANDSGPNFLYRNNRNGTFTEMGFLAGVAVAEDGNEQASMGVALGDYLHTGGLAIFLTHFSDEYAALYRQDKPLEYSDVSFQSRIAPKTMGFVGWGTSFFDFDNDGWQDLMAVNGHVYPQVDQANVSTRYAQRILLFQNQRDGTFNEIANEAGEDLMVPRVSRGAAFGDFDNDGDVDVVINNLDGKPTILRNEGGNRRNWVSIRLRDSALNRDGIGARIKVVAADLVQVDEVRSGASYLSANDLRIHFGLGTNERIDHIEIRWPDGKIEKVLGPPINHFLTIQKTKGLIQTAKPTTGPR
jgi:hypothetical protein